MIQYDPVVQNLNLSPDYSTDVLRLDLLHPEISGNKWFKLKSNLDAARQKNKTSILTFGGAFSNHIAATAAACKLYGFKSIGLIRGEEQHNPTLDKARENGMQLIFVSRSNYALKDTEDFREKLLRELDDPYIIPEGGNNKEGILGCMEILKSEWNYDYVFCACGTAATYGGLLLSAKPETKIIGVSVLKGENHLPQEVVEVALKFFRREFSVGSNAALEDSKLTSSCISNAWAFNGYAGFDQRLVEFKNDFEKQHQIPLDHVYTTKLFYAVSDLLKKEKLLKGSKILIVHSGGLQGNAGFEERYGKH